MPEDEKPAFGFGSMEVPKGQAPIAQGLEQQEIFRLAGDLP
jgi:hypothetical protein